MTGFARASGQDETIGWTWEVRCVNGRTLDIRCRLPAGMERLEPKLREALASKLRRGNVNVTLQVSRTVGSGVMRINRAWLDELIAVAETYRDAEGIAQPTLDGLMGLRGVIEPAEDEIDETAQRARDEAMLASFAAALDDLVVMRRAEGEAIETILTARLAEVTSLTERAEAGADSRIEAARERLARQVSELLTAGTPLPEERLAQELAVLATKFDVREELDRLKAHTAAAARELTRGGAVGRKLDFLAQEFNREANTLCSKASDETLSEVGLALKAVIDQFREQVQNIE